MSKLFQPLFLSPEILLVGDGLEDRESLWALKLPWFPLSWEMGYFFSKNKNLRQFRRRRRKGKHSFPSHLCWLKPLFLFFFIFFLPGSHSITLIHSFIRRRRRNNQKEAIFFTHSLSLFSLSSNLHLYLFLLLLFFSPSLHCFNKACLLNLTDNTLQKSNLRRNGKQQQQQQQLCGHFHSFSEPWCWRVTYPLYLLDHPWYAQYFSALFPPIFPLFLFFLSFTMPYLFLSLYSPLTFLGYYPQPAPKYMVDNERNTFQAAPDRGILNGPVTGPIEMSSLKSSGHATTKLDKRAGGDFWIDEIEHGKVSWKQTLASPLIFSLFWLRLAAREYNILTFIYY